MAEKVPQNQMVFGPQNRKVIACRDWMAEKVPQNQKALELQKPRFLKVDVASICQEGEPWLPTTKGRATKGTSCCENAV
jgi:hypothetical protein